MNKPQSITILRGYLFSKQSKKKNKNKNLNTKTCAHFFQTQHYNVPYVNRMMAVVKMYHHHHMKRQTDGSVAQAGVVPGND